MKNFTKLTRGFAVVTLCALMVLPSKALAYGGLCANLAFRPYTIDTSIACSGGICPGSKIVYPAVWNCRFDESYPNSWACDDEAKQYMATVTPVKTVENDSWGRWFACAVANVACASCIVAAAAAGAFGGAVAGAWMGPGASVTAYMGAVAAAGAATGGAGGVACYYLCGAISAGDPCCWVDCIPDEVHKYEVNYKKGC